MKRRIVLLGPPASGKGTLADRLSSELGLSIVSPGDLLRAAYTSGTEAGRKANELTRQGRLVDDATINGIVAEWLQAQGGDGFVFDGYPRTLGQATALESVLDQRRMPLDVALMLEADVEVLQLRVQSRAICAVCGKIVSLGVHVASLDEPCPRCGGQLHRRKDDSPETLKRRLEEFAEKTAPLIQFYDQRKLLARVNTERPPEEVFQNVRTILE